MIRFHKPPSLAACLEILRDVAGNQPRLMAGGTDLVLDLRDPVRRARIGAVLDIWGLKELRGIEEGRDGLQLGPLVTYSDLVTSKAIARAAPLLAAVSREIGGIQIQNRGTIGGNIATGSPAGDTLPILLAHDAIVQLASASGTREVPFTGFYRGYRTSVMRPDEMIRAVILPAQPAVNFQFYRKVATRRAQAISKTLLAVRGARRPDGGFDRVAIGLASVAPTPVRAPRTEALIAGHRGAWDAAALAALEERLADDIHPIDDLRSNARYRSTVTFNLLKRMLTGRDPWR